MAWIERAMNHFNHRAIEEPAVGGLPGRRSAGKYTGDGRHHRTKFVLPPARNEGAKKGIHPERATSAPWDNADDRPRRRGWRSPWDAIGSDRDRLERAGSFSGTGFVKLGSNNHPFGAHRQG
jgi:hypothetical protein